MNLSDDELDAKIRQPRASLDAQRFSMMPKQAPLASPALFSTSSTTFLLPILLPASAVTQRNTETQKIVLKELSGRGDNRSSAPATAVLPPDIASADLYIAGTSSSLCFTPSNPLKADRTFLETSSGIAARELKRCYERMGAEGVRKGRLRTPYVITSLDVNGGQRYRVSLRQEADLHGENTMNGTGRPASIIPGISGLINSVIAGNARGSQAESTPRQTLRRPRSISEPRDSNHLINVASIGPMGGFIEPFGSAARQSLDFQRPASIDSPRDNTHPYLYPETKNSPFGPGVAYAEPSPPSSVAQPQVSNLPSLREMQSFESGLTARADESPLIRQNPTFRFLNKEPVLNAATMSTTPYSTLVFDILQTYRGAPLPERLSEASSEPTVHLSSSSTITAVPRDDPRFVIWGEVYTDRADDHTASQSSHTDLSSTSHSGVNTRRKASRSRSGDITVNLYPTPQRLVVGATIERWIAQLTSEREPDWPCFFLTYRIYISGVDLCHLLICRFHWALEKPNDTQDETIRAMVRARTFKMLRYWLLVWFRVDFTTNPALCHVLTNWLNTLRKDSALNNPKLRDALALVRKLKTLVRECKDAADKLSPVDAKDSISSLTGTNGLTAELDAERHVGNQDSVLFSTVNPKASRGTSVTSTLTSQQTPVLGVGFTTGGHNPPRAPSISAPVSPSHPLSSTQTVFQQPLHMAILAPGKPHGASQYPAVRVSGSIPMQHSTISRVLVNTMGRLGRWTRVLHARTGPASSSQLDCSGVSSFDLDQGHHGDQQYIRGIDDYIRSKRPPIQYQEQTQSYGAMLNLPADSLPSNISPSLTTLLEAVEHDADAKTPQPSVIVPRPSSSTADGGSYSLVESSRETLASLQSDESPGEREASAKLLQSFKIQTNATKTDPELQASEFENDRSSVNSRTKPSEELTRPTSDIPATRVSLDSNEDYGLNNLGSDEGLAHSVAVIEGQQSARHSVVSAESQRNSFYDSSEEDYGEPISGQAAWFSTRSPRSINLVDMDEISEEDRSDSEGVARPRLPKRLPHQRDFKYTSTVASLFLPDDVSIPGRSSEYLEGEEEDAADNDGVPRLAVTYRNLELIDSDDDEPRDAEAALRRLEGQVDREKQRWKQTKVDGWIQQALAAQKDPIQGEEPDKQSNKDELEEEELVETPPDETGLGGQPQIEERPSLAIHDDSLHPRQDQRLSIEERDAPTPVPDSQARAQPFPSLYGHSLESTNRGDANWSESQLPHHTHKHSQSLTHRPSFVKVSGSRVASSPFTPHHESFVLMNRSTKVAQHLTMIESDLWRNVKFEDLVVPSIALDAEMKVDVLYWGDFRERLHKLKGNTNQPSRHPNDLWIVRARFQLMVMFTASEVLLTRDALRPVIVCKFIRIALKCYTLNNFSCLVAIITGLGLAPVQTAIQKMPKPIGAYEKRIYEVLTSFASPEGNYRLIRETIDTLVAAQQLSRPKEASKLPTNPATPGFDASKGCLPFIGIYLSQLYKYDKLPDYVDPTAPTEPVEDESNGALTQPRYPEVFANLAPLPTSMTLEPLINVHKQRLIAAVVISFLKSQQLTHNYRFATEPKLHQDCLRLRALDMVTLHQLGQVDR